MEATVRTVRHHHEHSKANGEPLAAYHPDFGSPHERPGVDGPFSRAVRAGYEAHGYIKGRQDQFPIVKRA